MSAEGKTHWRSLEQRVGDPRAREFLEREFPEAASEPPEGITRRTMLTLLGASLSMAGLTACRRPVEKIVPYVSAPEEIIPGIPQRFATTLSVGHGAHGLVVESHEGRPTKIEGNELHPSSRGATSAAIQASILGLYDPDRSKSVLYEGERKTWPDFVSAWGEIGLPYLDDGGVGMAVLTEPHSSPTLAQLADGLSWEYPEAAWATWEPISDENVYAGVQRATGSDLQPVYRFERASVILSLDADFLLTESESVRHARGFADGRRVASTADPMNRLYVVESGLSLTGGNADHRLRLQSGQVAVFLARLAARLGRDLDVGPLDAGAIPSLEGPDVDRWIDVLARDLLAARGRGLIVAGRRQPPAVHAAALALNAALGNVGRTLLLHERRDAAPSRLSDLERLAGEMHDGRVSLLIVLGGNPAYNAPADLDFAGALEKVARVIHFAPYLDETSRYATWHVPQAHPLESWGDARSVEGVPSVVQPLIAPLYDGRSPVEMLGLISTGEALSAHELVRETWRSILGEADFEQRWTRVLHDGLLSDAAPAPVEPVVQPDPVAELVRGVAGASPATASDLEVVFAASPAVFDGRFANNGWLQELPDPVTKLTWDNAALMSPATAEALGLRNGDVAKLTRDGRELEIATWIVPGQADHSVTLYLGYGRRAAGRIGDGCGFDTYALRTAAAPDIGRGMQVARTGRVYQLVQTQDHGSMEGRPIVREADLAHFRQHPTFAREMVEHPPLVSLWEDHPYDEGYQWGMAIDLNTCIGCNACVTACQSENNIPIVGKEQVHEGREMHWIRVDRYFTGEVPDPQTVFQPVPCMHCENAPCEQVCPVAATMHDREGLNTMVYNRCIGTRYCSNNCPYKVRRFNFYNFTKDTPEVQKMAHNPDVTVRSRGVMEKCSYCLQRINAARIDAKLAGREIRDGDVRTACEQACPTRAITFGNVRDPESRVSKTKAQQRDYVMIAELNNRPRTSYLAKLRNPHPDLSEPGGKTGGHG
jgi:molybdopterin-containing oxidoreductase family iron-sulfur binding subunit